MSIKDKTGRRVIKGINGIVNIVVLTIIVLLLVFAGYALWDSEQIYQIADKSNYEVYKPTVENQGKSFQELQEINDDVFAWLTVYGTNIDYPVAQGEDNRHYVNTSVEGKYSYVGSIFMDYNNSRDFSDFNSILYGHHMQKKAMFGQIDSFVDRDVFDSHRYGNLYFDGKDHGIEFFAFIHTDAYDNSIFIANVRGDSARQNYLDGLLSKSMYSRDIGVTIDDHLILLSTCSASSTNGRDILVGRITDEVYGDTFFEEGTEGGLGVTVDSPNDLIKLFSHWLPWLLLVLVVLLLVLILVVFRKRKQKQGRDV